MERFWNLFPTLGLRSEPHSMWLCTNLERPPPLSLEKYHHFSGQGNNQYSRRLGFCNMVSGCFLLQMRWIYPKKERWPIAETKKIKGNKAWASELCTRVSVHPMWHTIARKVPTPSSANPSQPEQLPLSWHKLCSTVLPVWSLSISYLCVTGHVCIRQGCDNKEPFKFPPVTWSHQHSNTGKTP